MGVVYRAHDERLDRDIALKVLPSGALADEAARKRFRKEALALSRLNHPNIAMVFDFDTQDGIDFLVTEYIPGTTLDASVGPGFLPEKQVVRLGLQLAEGLTAAHEQGVVHRDLKPSNLRITPDGRLKILDFGIAKLLPTGEQEATETLTEAQGVTGTLPYMAPEQLRDEQPVARKYRAQSYLRRVVALTGATQMGSGCVLDVGTTRFEVRDRYVRRLRDLTDPKCTYEVTCFYSAHKEMPKAEQIATALLQLRNNPALFDSWHQCGLAFKADGQVFTRAQ